MDGGQGCPWKVGGSEGEIEVPDSVMSLVSSNGFDCLLLSGF